MKNTIGLQESINEYFDALQKVESAKHHLNNVLTNAFHKHGQAEFDNVISNEIVIKHNRDNSK